MRSSCPNLCGISSGAVGDTIELTILAKYDLTAIKLFAEVQAQGYRAEYAVAQRYMRSIRPPQMQPAFVRFEMAPRQRAQVDWSSFGRIHHLGQSRKLSCFALVLGYSRVLYGEFTISEDLPTLVQCHLNAFRYIGGIPREVLYDQMKTVVLEWPREHTDWNPQFADFAKTFGFERRLCRPRRLCRLQTWRWESKNTSIVSWCSATLLDLWETRNPSHRHSGLKINSEGRNRLWPYAVLNGSH